MHMTEQTQHEHEHKKTHHSPKQDNNRAILIGAVIIAIAILLHGVITGNSTTGTQKTTSLVTKQIVDEALKTSLAHRYFEGTVPTEPIVFTEFSDTECPFCKSFHPTIASIIAEGNGKYAWVYRHFPLSFHPKAQKQAEVIECVRSISGDQKALHFLDIIYKVTPANNKLEEVTLYEISDRMKLPTKKIKECADAGTFTQKVKDSIQEGIARGVQGTPHTIISQGVGADAKVIGVINGAQPKEAIQALLDQNNI
jgi:protein-disulfide isomerase